MIKLLQGDALRLLPTVDAGSVAAVITDPPYSSGGLMRSDRLQSTAAKYVRSDVSAAARRHNFEGDNRDQRSYKYWSHLWMSEASRVLEVGGYLLCFTDWRQLPTITDAIQSAGLLWRGIVPWDKGLGARGPHTGYFRHQCEYVVWATNGPCLKAPGRGPFPGCHSVGVLQSDKFHQAGKPAELLRRLVACVRPGALVCDPFMGSGTTGVACKQTGRGFLGFERDPGSFGLSSSRIAMATPYPFFKVG